MIDTLKGWLALAGVLVVWEAVCRIAAVPHYLLPTPSYIAAGMWSYREPILAHATTTMLEAPVGFALGCGSAIATALLFRRSRALEVAILPFTVILQGIPIVALTPVLALILGRNYVTIVVVSAIICFFPVLINAVQGLASASDESVELMHVLAANRSQTFWMLRLPASLPFLFNGFRVAAPGCILGAMVAEWLAASKGLGFYIFDAAARWQTPAVWGAIASTTLLNLAAFGLVVFVEKRRIRWHDSAQLVDAA
jgi:NitT/TauT family transport system permease protein